jgi:hypothetical protein
MSLSFFSAFSDILSKLTFVPFISQTSDKPVLPFDWSRQKRKMNFKILNYFLITFIFGKTASERNPLTQKEVSILQQNVGIKSFFQIIKKNTDKIKLNELI